MFNTYQVKCKSAGVKIIISTTKLLKYEKFYKQKKVGGGGCPRKWMSQKNFKKIKIKKSLKMLKCKKNFKDVTQASVGFNKLFKQNCLTSCVKRQAASKFRFVAVAMGGCGLQSKVSTFNQTNQNTTFYNEAKKME
ncbi:hypothetical protein T4A_9497 [Trichinella pseudospiralis]|uniref:Uncharacterized protein n=1 Tax=Trichinella pseudospiralis TaxID=6337 RepID=A0A0V1EXG7_TRIPS|nr:hypothetical protein T4A_9497 [Trichinella pseudospiralis]